MQNKKYLIITIICIILVIGLCSFLILNDHKVALTDKEKFKKEYEVYNNEINPSTNKEFVNIIIDENNPVVYKTGKEILDVIKNETAIIYFGYPESDLARTMLPNLLKVLKDANYNTLYYVDIYEIRDEFVFNGSIMPSQTKKGTDAYYEIVKLLNKYLNEYYVLDNDGNRYDTLVKRLYAPSVITVKDGKVLDFYYGTINNKLELDDEEKELLQQTFKKMLEQISVANDVCSSNTAC